MGVAALGHPGYAAMNVQGFGAGVGRVGPYYEQGNWYRGGAVQMLFIAWLYGEQNQVRPMFPPNTSQEDLIRASKSFDLAQHAAAGRLVEGAVAPAGAGHHQGRRRPARHLRRRDAGRDRRPDDPARAERSGVVPRRPVSRRHEARTCPGLWFMSWYDVSVGPNLALYNHVRKTASPEVANQQWAVIAPVAHCAYTRATADTVVGERSMGDARLDYNEIVYGFFDRFLKGEQRTRLDTLPKVTYYTMGSNKWQTSDTWPPAGAQPMTFYLSSGGQGEHAERRRRADGRGAGRRQARCVHLRPDEPGAVVRRQRLLHGQRGAGRLVRSAADGSARRHPRLHLRAVQGRDRGERADHADAVRLVGREGHRLHRQGARRLPGRARLQPRRVDPADALSRRLRQAAGVDGIRARSTR